jgi:ribosome-associated translation inhibitor RaiA
MDKWTKNTQEIALDVQQPTGPTGILEQLRLGTGFTDSDRDGIIERLAPLAARLRSFREHGVELELSVKDRSGIDPRVTLECRIAGHSRLVATSKARDLSAALTEVRDDLVRQIDETKTRRAPRNSRLLRRARSTIARTG